VIRDFRGSAAEEFHDGIMAEMKIIGSLEVNDPSK
jgi:hypothetical protein